MKKIFIGSYLLVAATCMYAQKFEQLTKILAADRAVDNNLGTAVAISDKYAVVAASEIPSKGAPSNCNCVYVFEKTSTGDWQQVQKLISPDASSNRFGYSVALNGNYIIVGAPGDDNSTGAAYAFLRNASGNWIMEKKLVPSAGSPGDFFGTSVSITSVYGRGDWSYVVIGAPGDADFTAGWPLLPNAGSAYFFSNLLGYWAVINKMYPIVNTYFDRHAGAAFGSSVSISGTTVVVGAPGEKEDTTGSNPMDAAGAAYVFERNGSGAMELVHKIVNWDRAAGDQFGYAVALDRNTLVVGAPFEDEDARMENTQINAGSVYVFRKGVDGRLYWDRKLCANDRATGDNFGTSVSVNGNLNIVVVGSVGDDENANNQSALTMAGSAYVFRLFEDPQASVWKQLQKIVPFDRAEVDWFGYAVGIDSTSTNIIVTAPFQDKAVNGLNVSDAGAIYVFKQMPCTATTSSISPSVCRSYTSPSKKYTWSRTGTYKDTVKNKQDCDSIITINLTITNIADTSVSVRGNTLTAAAVNATYEWIDCATDKPINVTTRSLIATVNGTYKVKVDQEGCKGTSSCYTVTPKPPKPVDTTVNTNPETRAVLKEFVEINKLVPSDRNGNEAFGYSVAISGDYAVVGANVEDEGVNGENPVSDAGAVYIFKRTKEGKWKQVQKIVADDRQPIDYFGYSVAISYNHIVVGVPFQDNDLMGNRIGPSSGAAYIFERNDDDVWVQKQKLITTPIEGQIYFGTSVAIDGNTIAVGCPGWSRDEFGNQVSNITATGGIFIFEKTGGSWVQKQIVVAQKRGIDNLGDDLGVSVSICGDLLIAGAWGADFDAQGMNRMEAAGAAYIFERTGGRWREVQKIVPPDRAAFDEFGFSVGISGDNAIISARRKTENTDPNSRAYTGNAYIFTRKQLPGRVTPSGGVVVTPDDGKWKLALKINPEDRRPEDYLGWSVGISGDYAIVSALKQDTDSLGNYIADGGAIYIYYQDKNNRWVQVGKMAAFDRSQLDYLGQSVAICGCDIIGSTGNDQEDDHDQNALSAAGSAYIFSAVGCKNVPPCYRPKITPGEKEPILKKDPLRSNNTSEKKDPLNSNNPAEKKNPIAPVKNKDEAKPAMPQKAQSPDLKAGGNDVSIDSLQLGNEGLKQVNEVKKSKVDSVKKTIKNLKNRLFNR